MRHRQLLKGLAALALTVALVVGVPAVLIAYVGWPLPTRLPTLEEIHLGLRSGIDPTLLINTLAVVVWVTWVQLVTALGVEVVAAVRGKASRRVPVLPGLQTAAARLVATVTLVAASLGPLRPHPAAGAPLSALMAESTHHSLVLEPPTSSYGQSNPTQATARPVSDALAAYQVGRFDALWKIAETTLGDGRRWQEIRDLNLGKPTADGQLIAPSTEHVAAGSILLLPADATLPTPAEEDSDTEEEAPGEVVVEPGDHFWSIAQEALQQVWGRQPTSSEIAGYWRQVIDVNRPRLLPPYDPNLIFPGQTFQLPAVPDDPAAAPADPTDRAHDPAQTERVVEPGDHFWSIAQEALQQVWGRQPTSPEIAGYWQQVIDANRHRLLPPYDPNLIFTGQTFQLPAVPGDPAAPAPPAETGLDTPRVFPPTDEDHPARVDTPPDLHPQAPAPQSSSTTSPDAGAHPPVVTLPTEIPRQPPQPPPDLRVPAGPSEAGEPAVASGEVDQDEGGLLPIATTIAGLGVLAAGLIALISRLRRTQLRHRRPGTTPTPPPATATGVEATLRAAAAPTATQLVDLALRAMARHLTTTHTPPPQVVGVHLSPNTLRVLLWTPHHEPPPGWQVDDDGRSWTLPTDTDPAQLRRLADGIPAPYPALVTVGHGDRTQLLLDLEYLGAVQVTGDPDDVTATCHTMATELAASPLADTLQVICVGFGSDLAHLERIQVVDHLADVLDHIDEKVAAVAQQAGTWPLEGRLSTGGGDRWDPLVILDPNPSPPPGASKLLAAAHRGRAVCAVVGYPTGDRWQLHIAQGKVRVDPLGYTFDRRNLTPTEQAAIADLITAAKDLEGLPDAQAPEAPPTIPITVTDPAADTGDTHPPEDDPEPAPIDPEPAAVRPEQAAPDHQPTPPLEVRVLGTLRVDGLTERFPQLKCPELVTYLALHRHGVEADTLMEALWPEQPPDYRRLNILTSRARLTLGHRSDGDLYFPHITSGRLYGVSPQLGCDLDRFTQHLRSADQATPADAIPHLRAALELVEGPPFNGAGTGYNWAHTEGIITHAIVAVDNTAHRLAQLALQADDPDQATWAARKGLTATGACEECYRNLMRAAIAQDDRTALEATFDELLAVVDADQGPDAISLLDPETIHLYEQHNPDRRRHAG